jgi:hypothetical protein
MAVTRRRLLQSGAGGIAASLFRSVGIGWGALSPNRRSSPDWAGQGSYRLLVKVDPLDISPRKVGEMPAEIIIDLGKMLRGVGANVKANIASLQVMSYDPATGKPLPYGLYAYARSPYDRPFRWYDAAIPYEFPEFPDDIDQTKGEIRRVNQIRGGYFYNAMGEWESGHLAWLHTQNGEESSYYAIYFDPLQPGQLRDTPPHGWLGDGMPRCDQWSDSTTSTDTTRIELDDWDDDGRVDILFGEEYGHFFWLPNLGTRKQPDFRYYQMVFGADGLPIDTGCILAPKVTDWDGDGVKDLLAGTEWNRIVFFKNVGTNRDRKLVYKGFLRADGQTLQLPTAPVRKGSSAIFQRDYHPVLEVVDWDGDGQLDLLAGGYITGRIYFYKNVGREADGMPILEFRGPLEADGQPLNVGDWCAAPCIADFDGDGDLDLITGNMPISAGGGDSEDQHHFLRYYENVGTRTHPVLTERPFPKVGSFPHSNLATPRAADWDGDGLLDLVVSARDQIYLFKNIGTKTEPKFLVHDKPVPASWGHVDLPGTGGEVSTQFIDWNSDGLVDIVSNYKVWINTGKGNPGVYKDPISILPPGEYIAHPSGVGDDWFWPRMYDLDQDGKLDVLFGDWWGRIWFHQNLSTPEREHFDTTGYPLKLVNGEDLKVGPIGLDPAKDFDALQGARTVFTVADFDQDGRLDLVVGDTFGKIRYYKNVGTKEKPVFALPVEVGDQKLRLLVEAVDWNHDGRMDIIAGSANGSVRVYLNVGTKGNARFAEGFDPHLPPILQPRVLMADLNGDGDEDLFIPSTQGSCLVNRQFLRHGYASGTFLTLEKKG